MLFVSKSGNKPEDFDLQMNGVLKQGKWIRISGVTKWLRLNVQGFWNVMLCCWVSGFSKSSRKTLNFSDISGRNLDLASLRVYMKIRQKIGRVSRRYNNTL
jgi:hypothetical protein